MTDTSRYNDIDALLIRHREAIEWVCWQHADDDPELCKELVQQAYIAIWRRHGSLRGNSPIWKERAWVMWQCLSVCSHYWRKKRLTTVRLDEEMHPAVEEDDSRELIEEMAVDLSPRERQLLNLLLNGFTKDEIAKEMDIKPSSVDQLHYRMVENMRKTYEKINKT